MNIIYINVDSAFIFFVDVGYETLLWILLLQHVVVQSIDVLRMAMVITASSVTTYCSQQDMVHLVAREVMMNFKSTSLRYPFETCRQWIVRSYFVWYAMLVEPFGVVLIFSSWAHAARDGLKDLSAIVSESARVERSRAAWSHGRLSIERVVWLSFVSL